MVMPNSAPFSNMRDDVLNTATDSNFNHNQTAFNIPSEVAERDYREYWCKNVQCGKKVLSKGIPPGWLLLRKNNSNEMGTLFTVAITCSWGCLLQDMFTHYMDIIKSMQR